jgi:5-deoxy-glucuronate isomerase
VVANPGLHFKAGGPGSSRTLNMLLAKNVQAGRLMAGVTWSEPGNWTSWPPHEHADLAEELYVYYDMPPEAFAIQMVYTDKMEPERIEMVRDGDVVIMPKGFHPNVSIPGYPISFLWVMAADRELEDRKFGVVNVHPDFAQAPSGLDKGR